MQQPNVQPNPVQSTIVAVALIALVGVMFWRATGKTADKDLFPAVWAGAGTLVGVLVGAVPSFFFRAQATAETNRANTERHRAAVRSDQAIQLANLITDPAHIETAKAILKSPEPLKTPEP